MVLGTRTSGLRTLNHPMLQLLTAALLFTLSGGGLACGDDGNDTGPCAIAVTWSAEASGEIQACYAYSHRISRISNAQS